MCLILKMKPIMRLQSSLRTYINNFLLVHQSLREETPQRFIKTMVDNVMRF